MTTKTNDFRNLPDVLKQADTVAFAPSEGYGKIQQRHWFANIGLKESYDLVDRDLWDWNYSIFTGHEEDFDEFFYIEKLNQFFPTDEKSVAETLLKIYAWSQNTKETPLIRERNFSDLLAWIHIFRLPLDVIDFLKWIGEKVKFKIPAFHKKKRKHKSHFFYMPYQELYRVYKSNALK